MKYNFIWKLLGYDVGKYLKELNKLQFLKLDSFTKEQIIKRNNIFQHHYNNNSFYRTMVGEIDDGNWSKLPIMTKRHLQQLTSINNNYRSRHNYIANTSGSSGEPFWFFKDKECHALSWAYIIKKYAELGADHSALEARFFGSVSKNVKLLIKENIKDIFLKRYRFDVFDQSDTNMEFISNSFRRKPFTYIYGYTNSILAFGMFFKENNHVSLKHVCPSLKFVLVTAEVCSNKMSNELETIFGVPVYREYGSSETSIIAIENKHKKWEIASERIYVEIVDEKKIPLPEGEIGNILVTDLFNKAMPFIRYDIGDRGSLLSMEKFPYVRIQSLHGRESDTILLPSGNTVPGLAFYYISRSILENESNIQRFIIIQQSLEQFEFQYIATQNISQEIQKQIISASSDYLENGLKYNFNRVDTIARYQSGKIKHFVSDLN